MAGAVTVRILKNAASQLRAGGSRSATCTFQRRAWSRRIHTRLELPYSIENGLGDFLPPAALKTVAIEYQQGLLDRLNNEVAGERCPS